MMPKMENRQRSAWAKRQKANKHKGRRDLADIATPRMLASCWCRGYSISYELPTNQFERALSSRGCTCRTLKCLMRDGMRCARLPGTSLSTLRGIYHVRQKYQRSSHHSSPSLRVVTRSTNILCSIGSRLVVVLLPELRFACIQSSAMIIGEWGPSQMLDYWRRRALRQSPTAPGTAAAKP